MCIVTAPGGDALLCRHQPVKQAVISSFKEAAAILNFANNDLEFYP